MKVSRAEMYELSRVLGRRRDEDAKITSGLAATMDRVRAYWAKAEADPRYRQEFGSIWTLDHCERRWKTVKAAAVAKMKLVRR